MEDKKTQEKHRELISEEELIVHHSKEMYYYLKSTLRFEKKVQISKKILMQKNFEEVLNEQLVN